MDSDQATGKEIDEKVNDTITDEKSSHENAAPRLSVSSGMENHVYICYLTHNHLNFLPIYPSYT
jgi:hypothetical protein